MRPAVQTSDPGPRSGVRGRRLALLWLVETAVIAACYQIYSLIADAAPRHRLVALKHTEWLVQVERRLHLDIELHLNRLWAASTARMEIGNYYYDVMHFLVPLLVLGWLSTRPAAQQRPALLALALASLIALAVFWWWPAAPPRLLPGSQFVDTLARVPTLGSGGSHGMTAEENPFAAVPSLHVTWALWAAVCVARLGGSRWLVALAGLHVLLTVAVVVLTGNHLLLDAVAGAVVLAVSFALATALFSRFDSPVRSRSWR